MKKTRIGLYCLLFLATFVISAVMSARWAGGAPTRLMRVEWNDEVGKVYRDLPYAEDMCYDLYLPSSLEKEDEQFLILYIHGGSFNSGSKEDGEVWCKYYASKGYVTASLDYSLQNGDNRPSLRDMCVEIETCVGAIKAECAERGYTLSKMAPMGVSAGGTLAMNYAYTKADTSAIPVAFVFQVAAPTDFDPEYWDILKKADHIQNDADFVSLMTGETITDEMINSGEYEQYIDAISPARLVGETSVPTLCCYGAKDHVVPLNQKYLLFHALKKSCVTYDYIEFPHSNHGMYADTDKLQEFIDLSLDYCRRFFAE